MSDRVTLILGSQAPRDHNSPFDDALTYPALRKAESVGRPAGSKEWLADMKAKAGVKLAPARRGPKPKESAAI